MNIIKISKKKRSLWGKGLTYSVLFSAALASTGLITNLAMADPTKIEEEPTRLIGVERLTLSLAQEKYDSLLANASSVSIAQLDKSAYTLGTKTGDADRLAQFKLMLQSFGLTEESTISELANKIKANENKIMIMCLNDDANPDSTEIFQLKNANSILAELVKKLLDDGTQAIAKIKDSYSASPALYKDAITTIFNDNGSTLCSMNMYPGKDSKKLDTLGLASTICRQCSYPCVDTTGVLTINDTTNNVPVYVKSASSNKLAKIAYRALGACGDDLPIPAADEEGVNSNYILYLLNKLTDKSANYLAAIKNERKLADTVKDYLTVNSLAGKNYSLLRTGTEAEDLKNKLESIRNSKWDITDVDLEKLMTDLRKSYSAYKAKDTMTPDQIKASPTYLDMVKAKDLDIANLTNTVNDLNVRIHDLLGGMKKLEDVNKENARSLIRYNDKIVDLYADLGKLAQADNLSALKTKCIALANFKTAVGEFMNEPSSSSEITPTNKTKFKKKRVVKKHIKKLGDSPDTEDIDTSDLFDKFKTTAPITNTSPDK